MYVGYGIVRKSVVGRIVLEYAVERDGRGRYGRRRSRNQQQRQHAGKYLSRYPNHVVI